jgi:hypothetical protein
MHRFARAALTVLLMSAGAALAACAPAPPPIKVTTTADVVADDGVTSLREAFARADGNATEDTVELVPGATYSLTDCAAGALLQNSSPRLTVTGDRDARTTIRQTCTDTRIVAIGAATSWLTINGVTLVGGPGSGATVPGAGIRAAGNLVLVDAVVTGVNAGPNGTVIEANTSQVRSTEVSFTRGSVHDNTGTAVRMTNGTLTIADTRITDNVGDGIRIDGGARLDADNAVVSRHTGWGIHGTGEATSSLVVDLYFPDVSDNAAGGVFCSDCLVSTLGGVIEGNGAGAAPGSGGGIMTTRQRRTIGLEVRYTRVIGNEARRAGGGIFVGSTVAGGSSFTSIREAEVSGNLAIGDGAHGGGVAVTVGALDMFWNKFSANVAGGSGSDGGGIYFRGTPRPGSEPRFYRSVLSEISGNEAGGRGGGAFIDTGTYVVPELEITSGDSFSGNTASGQGGGLFLTTDMPIDFTSSFFGNTAGGQGGGAYLDGSGAVPSGRFHTNRATEGGGLFAVPTSDLTVENTSFSGNTASVRGGGLAAGGGGGLDITNTTFSGNSAPRGGGLSLGTGPSSLSFVTMADNIAPTGANVATSGGLLETYAALLVLPLGGGANCAGGVSPQGSSFVSDASCGAHPTDTTSAADPQLEPLAVNGTGTPTRLPRPTSPIRNTVATGACTAGTDQRGQPRPQGPGCEPGAVEVA